MTDHDLNDANKAAWEHLYATTRETVWGREPVGFLPTHLPDAADLPPGGVLDAATGEGRNLGLLCGYGRPVTACDASPAALAKIPAAWRNGVRTLVCDLSAVPLPSGEFALILLSDVIETLAQPVVVLAEMRRLLAPGGLLLANIPGEDDGIAGVEMQPVPGGHGGWLYRGRYYYRFHGEIEAAALLERAGLEVVSATPSMWREEPHPQFREVAHTHRSYVLLGRRPA